MKGENVKLGMPVWYLERSGSPDFKIEPGVVEEIVLRNHPDCSYVGMSTPGNKMRTMIKKSVENIFKTRREAIDEVVSKYEGQIEILENKILNWEKKRNK